MSDNVVALSTPAQVDAERAVKAVVANPAYLTCVMQPIVDLTRATVTGYEILARTPPEWRLPPDLLFETAERLGCSVPMSLIVLDQVHRLRQSCPPDCFLTINLSPHDIADPRIQAQFRSSWSGLVVELTETAWPDDHEAVLAGVEAARRAGAMIAADDVGAGYAGLLQLVRLRPDFVKVDRELVARLGTDPAADAVVTLLGDLSTKLDAWLVVEGIEEPAQLDVAIRLGVPLAQGWLLGRPGPSWPKPTDLSFLARAQAREACSGTIGAFMREPRDGEVICDLQGRPLAVKSADMRLPAMKLPVSTRITSAIERALHRPGKVQRLAPLAVTDGQGVTLGLVDVETLVLASLHPATSNPTG